MQTSIMGKNENKIWKLAAPSLWSNANMNEQISQANKRNKSTRAESKRVTVKWTQKHHDRKIWKEERLGWCSWNHCEFGSMTEWDLYGCNILTWPTMILWKLVHVESETRIKKKHSSGKPSNQWVRSSLKKIIKFQRWFKPDKEITLAFIWCGVVWEMDKSSHTG